MKSVVTSIFLALLPVGISHAADELGRSASPKAIPAASWDLPFHRTEGWTGADAMYSVDLQNWKVLWLFADTWIGPIKDGRHAEGSRLVNNTIALHAISPDGEPPAPDAVQFRWGTPDSEGHPTAWITPADKETWYWVADGIVTKDSDAKPELVIFLWKMRRAKGDGVFAFALAGGAVAVIHNPHDDWTKWEIKQHDLPHTIPDPPDGEKPSAGSPLHRTINWGSELLPVMEEGRDWIYIYGYRGGKMGNGLLIARAPADRLIDFDDWQFRSKEGWSKSLEDATEQASLVPTEFSITPVEIRGNRNWLMVQSETMLGPHVMVRMSSSPVGPWSKPIAIYDVPDLQRNKKYFSYAAKGHPELSKPGELLITYVVNSFDFGAMIHDPEIYRPRFIRLTLDELPGL
ncbi:hypothetical protein K2Y11_16270 [bacterium]|nr:hypothetical protein [bacterium]